MSLLYSSAIPTERVATIEAALVKVFNTTDVTGISLLAGGLSGSAVYKITLGGRHYVLKLGAANDTSAFPGSLALASAAGIAPSLKYEDKLQGIVISDFIDNKPVRGIFAPDKLAGELGHAIKTVHAIPCNGEGKDLFETVDGMIEQFRNAKILSGPLFDECFQYYGTIKNRYPRVASDKVFSHNDLNPSNILCDGERIWIIDWDVAYLNDRYVDLANAANFFVQTEEQESTLLNAYFDHVVDDQKMARFYVMRQVCRIIYSLLMFQLAMRHKPAGYQHDQVMEGNDLRAFGSLMALGKLSLAEYEGQLMYGKALFNEAVHQMRTPRFADSLAQFE
ncbi:phosphotransferase [Chitinophaga sp. OAE865]|uniref:phosphotransferase n=1 Tax=Chitinophaga sp. OAE865 TaxID=2817898 RepID=UPI001AE45103